MTFIKKDYLYIVPLDGLCWSGYWPRKIRPLNTLFETEQNNIMFNLLNKYVNPIHLDERIINNRSLLADISTVVEQR